MSARPGIAQRKHNPQPLQGSLDWQNQARCLEVNPEIFFPEKGWTAEPARRVCQGCEVRIQCLTYALNHTELSGVWGAKTERERRDLQRRTKEAI